MNRQISADSAAQTQPLCAMLPYLQALQQQLIIISCPGRLLDTPAARQTLAQDVALLALAGARPLLVHDDITLGGALTEINRDLVERINLHGAKALGMSAADTYTTVRSPGVGALGVRALDIKLFTLLLSNNLLPVLMSSDQHPEKESPGLAAGRLGSLLAQCLPQAQLVLMDQRQTINQLGAVSMLSELIQRLEVPPSTELGLLGAAAASALNHGVKTVHMVAADEPGALIEQLLSDESSGVTLCSHSPAHLMADSTRYFHDCDTVLRPNFKTQHKCVVRF